MLEHIEQVLERKMSLEVQEHMMVLEQVLEHMMALEQVPERSLARQVQAHNRR